MKPFAILPLTLAAALITAGVALLVRTAVLVRRVGYPETGGVDGY